MSKLVGWVCAVMVWGAWGQAVAQADEMADLKASVTFLEAELAKVHERIGKLESHPGASQPEDALQWRWKDGYRAETSDGAFKLRVRGRVNTDFSVSSDDDLASRVGGKVEDGAEIRRMIVGFEGTIYDRINYEMNADLAGGVEVKDAFMEMQELPYVGGVQIGHFKEPFSLDQLTSSNYGTFMERSIMDVFAPTRNVGIMLASPIVEDRMTWAAGVFRDTDDDTAEQGTSGGGEYNFTTRITGLPWYEDKGARLLHLGAAYSRRSPNARSLRYRQRPQVHMSPRLVDTGTFTADSVDLFGQEAALIYGPLSLQGEFTTALVDSDGTQSNPTFFGFYTYASYFLTGEHRAYNKEAAAFTRLKPKHNFDPWGAEKGFGAWEVALRYSSLDLSSNFVDGRELHTVTAGLNWYLNPNTRTMLNYVFADLEGPGHLNTVQTRFQIDF